MTTTRLTAVLGLGPMGAALAHALRSADHAVTVWNRTPGRATALLAAGATEAPDADAAVAGADLVIVCLRDQAAVRDVLGGLPDDTLRETLVVNLTSATPAQARETAAWARERSLDYLGGAIMVPTPLIGDPDATILYSGEERLLRAHADRLGALAGVSDYRGVDPGDAALYDAAMLEVFFASLLAFLQASAMVTAAGFRAEDFVADGERMAALAGSTFAQIARAVDADAHPGDEDRLAMDVAFMDLIARTGREIGVDGTLPEAMHALGRRAVAAGHGEDGLSRIIDVLRDPSG